MYHYHRTIIIVPSSPAFRQIIVPLSETNFHCTIINVMYYERRFVKSSYHYPLPPGRGPDIIHRPGQGLYHQPGRGALPPSQAGQGVFPPAHALDIIPHPGRGPNISPRHGRGD